MFFSQFFFWNVFYMVNSSYVSTGSGFVAMLNAKLLPAANYPRAPNYRKAYRILALTAAFMQ